MSTCNFRLPNTKLHYTIGVDEDLNEFDYEDIKSNIAVELSKYGGREIDKWIGRDIHAFYQYWVEYYDQEYKEWNNAYIYVTVESGYYQGAMFDIDISELDGIKLSKTARKKIDTLWARIEKILAQNTLALVRTATFSNGEAIYEKADNKRSYLKAVVNGYL